VIGWLRPVILLPFSSLVGLAPGQIEAILVHELAHIRRFDHLVNLFQCLVETLMFYHPVLWWLTNWVRDERENCCDDVVLSVCSDRLAYARALATLEEYRSPLSPLALAATDGSLLGRIRRLLGVPVEPSLTATRKFCGMGLFLVGLLFILLGTSLAFARPSFQATARIKLGWEQQPVAGDLEDGTRRGDLSFRYSLETQKALITSKSVLAKVVEELGLKHAWIGKSRRDAPQLDQVVALLRKRVTVRPIPQTMLVEISAADESPERAAAVANGVVDAYRSFLSDKTRETAAQGVQMLEDQFRRQEERVRAKQAELGQQPGAPNGISAEASRRLETMRIETEGQIAREELLWQRLSGLSESELIKVLPTAAPDTVLNSLLESQTLAEQHLLEARKDFGDQHPEVVKARASLDNLSTKIEQRAKGIMIGLGVRVAAMKEAVARMKEDASGMAEKARQNARNEDRLLENQTELEDLQRFRQILYLKLASEKVDSALPRSHPVQLIDAASIPTRPAFYNRSGAIGLILLGLVLDGISLALLRGRPRLEAVAI
jgi:uncharacterized protein involved in exopolysaccharide biosynthesis